MPLVKNDDLKKLVGLKARLWGFSPSHDYLTYRLNVPEEDKLKYLIFFGCEGISTSVVWDITKPAITEAESKFTKFKILDGKLEISFQECRLMDGFELEDFKEEL